jgi:hypothetical protein
MYQSPPTKLQSPGRYGDRDLCTHGLREMYNENFVIISCHCSYVSRKNCVGMPVIALKSKGPRKL